MADPRNPLSLLPSYGATGPRGAPSSPGATQAAGDVATGLAIAPAVNQSFLNYLAGGIPNYGALTTTESGNIANLLHPTDFTDVQRRAAEQAVAGGYSGSQFGDINALHMTEDEKIRREMLGSQLLSGAAARLPRPFDPSRLLGYGNRTSPNAPGPVSYMGGPGRGGMPAAPLGSPGDAPAIVLPGTATPHNWLADIISRYSPEPSGGPPLYQTPTGGIGQGSIFMGDIDPETGLPVGNFTGGTPDYQSGENGGAPYIGDIPGQPELPDFQDFYA